MALIRPFKSIRPQIDLAEKVAELPYDVMTSDEARGIAKNNPYSFLHVDKAEIDLDKNTYIYDQKVYQKARSNLNQMISDNIFIQDKNPCLYIYRLTMNSRSQTGLVVCTSIDEYLEGKIKKHELTREDKEIDRINHVQACNANTGPIFLAYKAVNSIDNIISTWINEHEYIYNFTTSDNIKHEVWVINNADIIKMLIESFKKIDSLYIADGHHRNASAVKVGLKKREENPNFTGQEEFNFYLSILLPDNQLKIMDYNRVVKNLNNNSIETFIDKIKEKFEVTKIGKESYKPDKKNVFGMYLENEWYKLEAKENTFDKNDIIDSLDVSILQNNILEPILGIQDIRTDSNIDFIGGIRGLSELEKRVDSGEMKVAFSMYPTSIEELMLVADSNKIMPPKSTWFEPKLRSGLFIHDLE